MYREWCAHLSSARDIIRNGAQWSDIFCGSRRSRREKQEEGSNIDAGMRSTMEQLILLIDSDQRPAVQRGGGGRRYIWPLRRHRCGNRDNITRVGHVRVYGRKTPRRRALQWTWKFYRDYARVRACVGVRVRERAGGESDESIVLAVCPICD